MLAVGLMSGTSIDGIDAALIETDGDTDIRPVAFVTRAYDDGLRSELRRVMARALDFARPAADPEIARTEHSLTVAHAEVVGELLDQVGKTSADLDVIGFHGQTIAHRPDQRWTWQIGDGGLLASLCDAPVVNDFRTADVEAGGQGAPLAPLFHHALVGRLAGRKARSSAAILNLGGVGNISWFGASEHDWGAFDTGPANALIDDWVRQQAGLRCDEDGRIAGAGHVHEDILASMLDLSWFDIPPPKSLDRHDFNLAQVRSLSTEDGAATLTAFTAETVRLALRHLPANPDTILVTGGGRLNPVLMRMVAERTCTTTVPIERAGWDGDALEAQAFAYLAVRTMMGKPTSYPQSTGAPGPVFGGRTHRPGGRKRVHAHA